MRTEPSQYFYQNDASSLAGDWAGRPALIVGDSPGAIGRGRATVDGLGLRVSGDVPVAEALDRLDAQASLAALWIEIERDEGPALDALLDRANLLAASGVAVVVSARSELVDPISARIDDPSIAVLLDATEAERAAALAVACVGQQLPASLNDVAAERQSERLRQLSDEVGRIAATLARLSTGPDGEPMRSGMVGHAIAPANNDEAPAVSLPALRTIIRARRLRARYFDEALFADPAWDMLLDLLQAEVAQVRVPVSSLCIAAAVPATTALRWIKTMTDAGLFLRRPDPHDGRRVFIELAPQSSNAMRRYFAEVGKVSGA